MKRIISLLLIIAICSAFYACGKSESAKACEELIAQIGTLTLDSEEALLAAEKAYNALTSKEQLGISESAAKLKTYRKEYDEKIKPMNSFIESVDAIGEVTLNSSSALATAQVISNKLSAEQKQELKAYCDKLTKAKIDYLTLALDDIGEVTLDSESKIATARNAYNSLTVDEKKQTTELGNRLTQAIEAFHAVKVIASIDAIGTVTLDSKDAIQNAATMYDGLTSSEKALVTNHSKLENALTKYNSLVDAEEKRIRSKFWTKTDKVEGITWYHHDNHPYYINTRTFVLPYIGVKSNGHTWMVLEYNYHSGDWIFWEKATIMIDGVKHYYSPGYFNVNRETTSYGNVCETSHDTSPDLEMLKKIANSTETIIRFQGDNYHRDYTVSKTDKTIIKETLALYEMLKTK